MKKSIIIIAVAILCLGSLTSCSVSKLSLNEDGIPFVTDSLTKSTLSDWTKQNSLKCRKLIQGKTGNYTVPSMMIEDDPCLVYLILKSKAIKEGGDSQELFDMYSIMNEDQIYRLYNILYKSKAKERGNEINRKAYDFASRNNYKKAIKTIDKAIALYPNQANSYDSKGEFLLKMGKNDAALEMWQKAIEIDPDFLSKHNSTPLYEGLKALGLIE